MLCPSLIKSKNIYSNMVTQMDYYFDAYHLSLNITFNRQLLNMNQPDHTNCKKQTKKPLSILQR